ncbi:MAG: sulfatase [Bryobacteraceae bacterium]
MLTRRHFFFGSLALPAFAAKKPPAPAPPSLLLLAPDNLPAWIVGSYGNQEVRTPHLDALAKTGTRFLNHSVCAPEPGLGRATLVTGRTPMQVHDAETVPAGEAGLEKLLAGLGYATLEAEASAAPKFLDAQAAGKPFFLHVRCPYLQPPYDGMAQKYHQQYAQIKFDTFNPDRPAPNAARNRELLADPIGSLRKYGAAVSAFDDEVGAIIARLTQKGLLQNTLIVFTATCGNLAMHHGLWGAGGASEPRNMFQEAVATPLIWSWLGHVPPDVTRPDQVSAYDLVPTICELASSNLPSANLCGRSYLALATGKSLPKKQPWRTTVFAADGPTAMARVERYKLVERTPGAHSGPGELYDLVADPGERQNQYDNQQFLSVRTELAGSLAAWKQRYSV